MPPINMVDDYFTQNLAAIKTSLNVDSTATWARKSEDVLENLVADLSLSYSSTVTDLINKGQKVLIYSGEYDLLYGPK